MSNQLGKFRNNESDLSQLEDSDIGALWTEILRRLTKGQTMKTQKKWNCEIQTTGGYSGDESELKQLEDYINEQLYGRIFFEDTVQFEVDLMFWDYLDSLDCRATANAIADNCAAIAF